MLLWPAVTVVGFVMVLAFVIAMGTRSTARYEREQRAEPENVRPAPRRTDSEPVEVARAA